VHFAAVKVGGTSVPVPDYWENAHGTDFSSIVPVPARHLACFQELFDKTHLKLWTRDRGKDKVPRGYVVTAAYRNENCQLWRRHTICRSALLHGMPVEPMDVKTTTVLSKWGDGVVESLQPRCNEWYLFHGTSVHAAASICKAGFKMSFAGSHTGSLYGRGTYFAESVTKSDEYSQASGPDGHYTVLLCRVLGGHVKYTDETEPDPEALVSACIEGPFNCVLGDREKCKGTFREFVAFDSEGLYPEYIIHYMRIT